MGVWRKVFVARRCKALPRDAPGTQKVSATSKEIQDEGVRVLRCGWVDGVG